MGWVLVLLEVAGFYGIQSYSIVVGYAEGFDSMMVRFLGQLVALWQCS